jgi:hemolysin III
MQCVASRYTFAERLLDGIVHGLGGVMSLVGAAVLVEFLPSTANPETIFATAAYGVGLVAMIWLSAAYNLISHPTWKERVRRYDHAAIFLMIAGTYTPFAVITLGGTVGRVLLSLVWLAAIGGIALKLLKPRRYERLAVVFYLMLGWIGLPLADRLFSALPLSTLVLLGVGGLLYTTGVAFHLRTTLPFQNAIWHAFVLAAATCHFAAILDVVAA